MPQTTRSDLFTQCSHAACLLFILFHYRLVGSHVSAVFKDFAQIDVMSVVLWTPDVSILFFSHNL